MYIGGSRVVPDHPIDQLFERYRAQEFRPRPALSDHEQVSFGEVVGIVVFPAFSDCRLQLVPGPSGSTRGSIYLADGYPGLARAPR